MAHTSRSLHFGFADPMSKEVCNRTTRYRLLKRRRIEDVPDCSSAEEQVTVEYENSEVECHDDEVFETDELESVPHDVFISHGVTESDAESDGHADELTELLPVESDQVHDPSMSEVDSDAENENEACSSVQTSKHVFANCPITETTSNLLILRYSTRHNITQEAIHDLLQLLSIHCPTPNAIPRSLHSFHSSFPSLQQKFTMHYFCSSCLQKLFSKQTITCPNIDCGKSLKTKRAISSFIELSIETQITNILQSTYVASYVVRNNYYKWR